MRRSNKKHNPKTAKIYVDKIVELLYDFDADTIDHYELGVVGLELVHYEHNIEAATFRLGDNSVSFYKSPNMDGHWDDYGFEINPETFDYAFKINGKYAADSIMAKLYNMVVAEYGKKIKAAKKALCVAIDKKYKSSK